MEKAVEPTTKDKRHDKETPQEELEKLEHEDELRVKHLHGMSLPRSEQSEMFSGGRMGFVLIYMITGNDSVFDDLQISKKEYPEVPTTW
jgi:hypothetical protein